MQLKTFQKFFKHLNIRTEKMISQSMRQRYFDNPITMLNAKITKNGSKLSKKIDRTAPQEEIDEL